MPRGKPGKTAEQAREESKYRLLSALAEHQDGLRNKDWWKVAGVSEDTLANWIPKLKGAGLVWKDEERKVYRITERVGIDELNRASLLRNVSGPNPYASYGGGPVTVFAFPPVHVHLATDMGKYFQRSVVAFWLFWMAQHQVIDARNLTGEMPLLGFLNELRKKMPSNTQTVTFSLNFEKFRNGLDEEQLSQILAFLKGARWMHGIETSVLESKALEFVRGKGRDTDLDEISGYLGVGRQETEILLDGLVDWGEANMVLHEEDAKGKERIAGSTLNVKLTGPKPFLKRTRAGKHLWYRFLRHE